MKTTNEIAQEAAAGILAITAHALFEDEHADFKQQVEAIITKAIEAAQEQGEPVKSTMPLTAQEAQELKAIGITGEYRRVTAFNDRPAPPKRQPLTPEKARELWVKHRGIMDDSEISYMAFMGTFRHFEAAINGGGA